MKRVVSCISLGIAGFFLMVLEIISFLQLPSFNLLPFAVLIISFGLPAISFLIMGLSLRSFHHWQRLSGITLLSVNGALALEALTLACMLNSPTLLATLQPSSLENLRNCYADWPVGLASSSVLTLLGMLLVFLNRKHT